MARKRFKITCHRPGRVLGPNRIVVEADHVIEAWDEYARFLAKWPNAEVEIVDREEVAA